MSMLKVTKLDLLAPLALVAGVVERKQAKAILANVRMRWDSNTLTMTCSDLEIQTTAKVPCETQDPGSTTVGAKKFLEIVRCLDDELEIQFLLQDGSLRIKQGRSSFKLATLPIEQFPMRQLDETGELRYIPRLPLVKSLQSTVFAIALQDVRPFLNGLLIPVFFLQLIVLVLLVLFFLIQCSYYYIYLLLLLSYFPTFLLFFTCLHFLKISKTKSIIFINYFTLWFFQ